MSEDKSKKQDPLVPSFKVTIKGKALSTTMASRVQGITFSDSVGGSKSLTIQIIDPNLEIVQDDIFVNEAKITASISVPAINYAETFSGYISCIDFDFPDSGEPVISITGLDSSHLFSAKKNTKTWTNMTRVQVIEKVVQTHGFSFENKGVTDTVQESIVQDNETDLALIERLVYDEIEGENRITFDNNQVVLSSLSFASKSGIAFHYKIKDCDIMSFSPQITKETKTEKTEKQDIESSNKTTEKATEQSKEGDPTVQGQPVKHTEVAFDYDSQTYQNVTN